MSPRLFKKGFTLIELIIVIAIIAIIVAAVFTALNPAKRLGEANDARRSIESRSIEQAIGQYIVDSAQDVNIVLPPLPTTAGGAEPICRTGFIPNASNPECIDIDDMLVPTYISALPVDDAEPNACCTGYAVYREGPRVAVIPLYEGTTVAVATSSASSADSSSSAISSLSSSSVQTIVSLALETDRDATTNAITLTAIATDQNNSPLTGIEVSFTVSQGTVSAITESAGGRYSAILTPSQPSGEISVTAQAGAASVQRTLVVLPTVDASWNQPEAVRGPVNVGWEDSAEVSPDGEWLIVGTYSPISLFCCSTLAPSFNQWAGSEVCSIDESVTPEQRALMNGGYDDDEACNISIGPVSSPSRPGFYGASRITETQVIDDLPSLGVTDGSFAHALSPVSSFGFRRQSDGSYSQPFQIGYNMDGYTVAPFGFSFANPVGSPTTLTYAYSIINQTGTPDIYQTNVSLGSATTLGTYSMPGPSLSNHQGSLLYSANDEVGNPHYRGGYVWLDNDTAPSGVERDIFVVSNPASAPPTPPVAGVSQSGQDEAQPHFDDVDQRLYFTQGSFLHLPLVSSHFNGGNPTSPSAWSAVRTELQAEHLVLGMARNGAIVAIGEPSVARIDGEKWLYFVYLVRRANTLDMQVGRVQAR